MFYLFVCLFIYLLTYLFPSMILPENGKQPYQVSEFVTVVLLECHLIVPVERGSVDLESHGRRIMEIVRNGCCLILPAKA